MSATTDNQVRVAGPDSLCVDCVHLMPVVTDDFNCNPCGKCSLLPEANVTRVRVCEEYQHYLERRKPAMAMDSACRGFVMAGNGAEAPYIEQLPESGLGVPDLIRQECDALRNMLLEKNRRYGNSALEPVRVFSKADPVEQIRVRLDDKLSRLMRGAGIEDEDVELDLMGYLILLRVARRMQEATV